MRESVVLSESDMDSVYTLDFFSVCTRFRYEKKNIYYLAGKYVPEKYIEQRSWQLLHGQRLYLLHCT